MEEEITAVQILDKLETIEKLLRELAERARKTLGKAASEAPGQRDKDWADS